MTEVTGLLKSPHIESTVTAVVQRELLLLWPHMGQIILPDADVANVWTFCQDQALVQLVHAAAPSLNLDLPTPSAHSMSSDIYWTGPKALKVALGHT